MELLCVALVMALLTLFTGDLPQLEVVESTINDDQFTDFVITTRGELPIDTNIVVLTYGPEFLDSFQLVDRAMLAQGLAAVFEMKPRVVGVDFLIERERPEYPDGDAMLAGLIADHPDDLIFGIFKEDSLDRFRTPPPSFGLSERQLGCINLMPGEDNVIRTFDRRWSTKNGTAYEELAVKVARRTDSAKVARLVSFPSNTFIIDYAAGIGEQRTGGKENAVQVFPNFPLSDIVDAIFSDDEAKRKFFAERIGGKTVMVGYADLRPGQVVSIADRFYTPLKDEKNGLPDMHGVAVHANIVNTILRERIVYAVPSWVNVLWGTFIVFLMYYGYEALRYVRPPGRRAFLMYPGFALLLLAGLIVPIFLFRYTPYKLSIYTPFAGLLLGPLVLGSYDKIRRIAIDAYYRRRLQRPMPPGLRESLGTVLAHAEPNERYVQSLHVLQRFFHACCDRLFAEAMIRNDFEFAAPTVARPTPAAMRNDLDRADMTHLPEEVRRAAELVELLTGNPLLRRSLRLARSLVIALNEINRQNAALDEEEREEEIMEGNGKEEQAITDTVMAAVGGMVDTNNYEEFEKLYQELEKFALKASELLQKEDGSFFEIAAPGVVGEKTAPFIVRDRCVVHNRVETFVYLSEQEDANNRDDFFDLLYAGDTMRCRPEGHPGLTGFREKIRSIQNAGESKEN